MHESTLEREKKLSHLCEFKFVLGKIVCINEQIVIVENTKHLTSREGSARDKMPQIRDIPYYTERLATLNIGIVFSSGTRWQVM